MPTRGKDPAWMWVAVLLIVAGVFAADVVTPPGVTVWIFFVPAIILCKLLSRRPLAPLTLAGAASALVVAGYFLQGERAPGLLRLAPINRGMPR